MSQPISEAVFEAIITQLKTIRPENGYRTDAGRYVFRARDAINSSELPAIVVWDAGEEPQGGTGDGSSYSMTINQSIDIEIQVPAEQADTGYMIGAGKADVKQCLLSWAPSGGIREVCQGSKIAVLAYEGAEALPRPAGADAEIVSLRFVATYQEGFGDPTRVL
jgi:hypothetical protein